jgi:hypothetical protein
MVYDLETYLYLSLVILTAEYTASFGMKMPKA